MVCLCQHLKNDILLMFSLQEWSFLGVECSPFLALADMEYCLCEHLNGKLLGSRFYWMF